MCLKAEPFSSLKLVTLTTANQRVDLAAHSLPNRLQAHILLPILLCNQCLHTSHAIKNAAPNIIKCSKNAELGSVVAEADCEVADSAAVISGS